ncbi:MAG: glycosyltransferase, partial [Clostridia bacterium]|nr:glycosyltransferase [Clostridia bacterium]
MRDKSISIVVPVYNGRKYLDELVMRITESTRGFKNLEIILVDDHSPDESFGKILAIASENPVVRGYLLEGNHGQQSAVLCGLSRASGDYVVIMDDDLENPPEAIPLMYEEMQKGFDAVYALDIKPAGRGLTRRTGSFIRDLTFRVLTDIPKGMKVCSYRMISSAL